VLVPPATCSEHHLRTQPQHIPQPPHLSLPHSIACLELPSTKFNSKTCPSQLAPTMLNATISLRNGLVRLRASNQSKKQVQDTWGIIAGITTFNLSYCRHSHHLPVLSNQLHNITTTLPQIAQNSSNPPAFSRRACKLINGHNWRVSNSGTHKTQNFTNVNISQNCGKQNQIHPKNFCHSRLPNHTPLKSRRLVRVAYRRTHGAVSVHHS